MERSFQRFFPATLVLMVSIAAHVQTPVYSMSFSTTGQTANGFEIQYDGSKGTRTLSSNLLTLRMTYPLGGQSQESRPRVIDCQQHPSPALAGNLGDWHLIHIENKP